MTNQPTIRLRALLISSFLLAAVALAASPSIIRPVDGRSQQDLFVSKEDKKSALTDSQVAIVEKIKKEATTAEVRVVEVKTDLLTPSSSNLKFNIRPGKQFDLLTTEVRSIIGGYTWLGEARAPSDDAVLIVKNGNVTGTVRTGSELYSIRPIGGGLHVIIKQSQNKFPPEHPPEVEQQEREPVNPSDLSTMDETPNTIHTLRVLVAYTPSAAAAFTDIDAFISVALTETNLSYTNSGIRIRAELAHAYMVDYAETGMSNDLVNFRSKEDSFMKEVHDLRDTHKADVCVLFIDDDMACGKADKIMATEDRAFAVVHYPCATGNYSFGHEIGHLQGARHNKEADPGAPFDYGHGHYNKEGKWRTVMSYDCPGGGCIRIPYWSNPNVKYKDAPMGTEAECNNSRVLNETAPIITSFRK